MNALAQANNVLVPPSRVHTFMKERHHGMQCGEDSSLLLAGALDVVLNIFIKETARQSAAKHRVTMRPQEVAAALDDPCSEVAGLTVTRGASSTLVNGAPARTLGHRQLKNPVLYGKPSQHKIAAVLDKKAALREAVLDRLMRGEQVDDDEIDELLPLEDSEMWTAVLPPKAAPAAADGEGEQEEPEEASSSSSSSSSSSDSEQSVAERTRSRKQQQASKKKRGRTAVTNSSAGNEKRRKRSRRE